MNQEPKTGVIIYKNVGTIKVDKNLIWDNTFDSKSDENTSSSTIDRTTFSGGSKFYSGLLIKQIK